MSLGVYLQVNDQVFQIKHQTTIGRASNNVIQIPETSVSKYHAIILCLKDNHQTYLTDLNSVNGTFLNGQKVIPQDKVSLKHNDSIQFGRSQKLFIFKWKNPPPMGKKINLKDYYFEVGNQSPKKISLVKQKPNLSQNPISYVQNFKNKPKPKQSKIKIPDISQFLRVKGQHQQNNQFSDINTIPQRENSGIEKSKQKQKKQSLISIKKKKPENKINFNSLNNFFNDNTQQLQANRKMNLYVQEQQAKKRQQQQQRKRKQQQIRFQLQKNKQQQLLLKKQLQMQKKLKQQEQKIDLQRKIVQQQMILRAKQREQQQRRSKQQLLKKQQAFVQQMQRQKQKQIEQLRINEERQRKSYQNSLQSDYQQKKRSLQLQAQALARQYQNIYRETIQKIRNDIKREQQKIGRSQENIQKYIKDLHKIKSDTEQRSQLLQNLKKNYLTINSRNKALILYASQIQNKIDNLKQIRIIAKQGSPDFKSTNAIKLKNRFKQLKDSIVHSRKLLKIKNNQQHDLQNQIKTRKISVMSGTGFSQKVQDYLQSVMQNHEQISFLKQQFYECMEQQKTLQSIWQADLAEYDQLSQHQRSINIQLNNNVKNIEESSRDNVRKLCQQRLHLLKSIQVVINQDKRKAAKYLIEQMVDLHQQIQSLTVENQNIHLKIGKIITQSQYLRSQNGYLSQLLFGQGSIHHLDNMKAIINQLAQKIQGYKDTGSLNNCIKLSNDILKFQKEIQFEIDRNKEIKQQQMKYMHNSNRIVKMDDKNPLNFFGQVLLKKDTQIQNKQLNIKSSKNQLAKIAQQIRILQDKKQKMSITFQKYKKTQIQQARNWMSK